MVSLSSASPQTPHKTKQDNSPKNTIEEAKKASQIAASQSSSNILTSWLLWRLILCVLSTLIIVQALDLGFSAYKKHNNELQNVKATAISVLNEVSEQDPSRFEGKINTLLASSLVNGITVFEKELNPTTGQTEVIATQKFGQPTNITQKTTIKSPPLSFQKQHELYIESDNNSYAFAVSIDTTPIKNRVVEFISQRLIFDLAVTLLITIVLILTISHWLIGPILFMRNNLIEASKNPEKPKLPPSPYNAKDTIGSAIVITQNLIKQNSFNLQQTKSSAEDKIYKLAYFDSLTKLPNRAFFLQQVERAISPNKGRPQKQFYIMAMDIDHFKDINDSMGHNVGDAILRSVGQRLKSGLPPSAIVSRTGEDEFAIMLEIKADQRPAAEIAQQALDLIRIEPFKVFNETLQVRASVGIVSFPKHGDDPEKLVKHADIALNKAKEDGRNTYKEYSEDFERAIQHRFALLSALRDAMEENQLVLFYQPQLDLASGRVIGAEALIRWWKPDDSKEGGTFISPGEFIPIAENSGLIVPMGEWIIRQAAQDCKDWNDHYGFDMRVAVNISAAQFAQTDLTTFTKQTLEDFNLAPEKMELEVTESVFMDDINMTIETLNNLHDLGVELAIDDFGTGYSSLSYLRQFPIDRLKIDQSFIRNALNNPDDASIAKTIIALGRSLNLKVIAEGVETREHENFLLAEGCDEVQGFRYAKPMPNDRFIEFCQGYNGDLRSFSRI